MAVHRETIQKGLGEHGVATQLLDEVVDRLDLLVVDVVGELGTSVSLEGAGRVAVLQVGGQLGLGVGPGSTSNRQVDECVVRVLLLERLLQSVQAFLLRSVGPPGEHAHLAAGTACLGGRRHLIRRLVVSTPVAVGAATRQQNGCRGSQCPDLLTVHRYLTSAVGPSSS